MIYVGIYEAFEAFQKHTSHYGQTSMSCVNQFFGENAVDHLMSYPHIVWVPTTDDYTPAQIARSEGIINGKRVYVEGVSTRRCGCDLYITHRDHKSLEFLLNDIINALYDTFLGMGTPSNRGQWELGSGRWLDRDGDTTNSVGYVQSVYFYVPIYRFLPAETLETNQVILTN